MAKTKTQEVTEVTHKIKEIFEYIRSTADDYLSAEDYKNPDVAMEIISTQLDKYNSI